MTSKSSSSTAPLPARLTRAEAYLAVYNRLMQMARSSQAREYFTLFQMDSASWREYDDSLNVWVVEISPGPQAYDLIRRASWFKVADVDFFYDVHWDDPRPAWLVHTDGSITPMGKGLLVEADIEQLNATGSLK